MADALERLRAGGLTVHELVAELRSLGVVVSRPLRNPSLVELSYRGRRAQVFGHGDPRRLPKAQIIHIRDARGL